MHSVLPVIRALILPDIHMGSRAAVAPPGHQETAFSEWAYQKWQELIQTHRNPDYLILTGDTVDGDGHKDPTVVWTTDVDEQASAAADLIRPLIGQNTQNVVGVPGSAYHNKSGGHNGDAHVIEKLGGEFYPQCFSLPTSKGIVRFHHASKNIVTEQRVIADRFYRKDHAPKIEMLVGGHLHHYTVLNDKVTILHLPCWKFMDQFNGFPIAWDWGAVELLIRPAGIEIVPLLIEPPREVWDAMEGFKSLDWDSARKRENQRIREAARQIGVPTRTVRQIVKKLALPEIQLASPTDTAPRRRMFQEPLVACEIPAPTGLKPKGSKAVHKRS